MGCNRSEERNTASRRSTYKLEIGYRIKPSERLQKLVIIQIPGLHTYNHNDSTSRQSYKVGPDRYIEVTGCKNRDDNHERAQEQDDEPPKRYLWVRAHQNIERIGVLFVDGDVPVRFLSL